MDEISTRSPHLRKFEAEIDADLEKSLIPFMVSIWLPAALLKDLQCWIVESTIVSVNSLIRETPVHCICLSLSSGECDILILKILDHLDNGHGINAEKRNNAGSVPHRDWILE